MAKKGQISSKPEGWLDIACLRQVSLTYGQTGYARQAEGIARFTYNLAAATHRFCRRNRLAWPTANAMAKAFNAAKREDYPFVAEVSKFVAQGAFADFDNALRKWRERKYQGGAPKFKKRKRTGAGGFLAAAGVSTIKYDGWRRIKLPVIGSVKMTRALPPDFIPVNVRIKRNNGRWYASIAGYAPPLPRTAADSQSAVGVDVGIQPLAVSVDSDGVVADHPNPKAFYAGQRKLARWQRAQARRTAGSRGWRIAQRRIDKIQRRITGLRSNAQHHISKRIAAGYSAVGIETLNVKGMDRLRWQAKAVRDAGIGELLRQIRYKANWHGAAVVAADQWYPSSKTCSVCGAVNAALRRESEWKCSGCGVLHDRNINAARNLLKLALGAEGVDVTPGEAKALAVAVIRGGETITSEPGTERSIPVNTQLALAF